VNKIQTATYLESFLTKNNYRVNVLHGKKQQQDREKMLNEFKAGKTQILIATDVASRGLNISQLPIIINYDFPSNLEQYVHRIGRTGRKGSNGLAFSFFTRIYANLAGDLIKILEEHHQKVDTNLRELVEKQNVNSVDDDKSDDK